MHITYHIEDRGKIVFVGAIDSSLFAKSFLLCLEGLASVERRRGEESVVVVGLINAGREKETEEESPIALGLPKYNVEHRESDCRRCYFFV